MERIPNGRYTRELREEAVKLVTEGGLAVDAAAHRLSLPKSTLANWVRAMKAGKRARIGRQQKPLSEAESERDTRWMTKGLVLQSLFPGGGFAAAGKGVDPSFRPWQSILLTPLRQGPGVVWHAGVHEQEGQLL